MFDDIAHDWKRKRNYPWKPFEKIISKWIPIWKKNYFLHTQSLLFLDLGAGSGRHSAFFLKYAHRLIDLDISSAMLKLNEIPSLKVQASINQLPFRDDVFDGIFSVAALHHIEGKNNRNQVRKDMLRVGRKRGIICFTVWRFYQKKFKKEYKKQMKEFPPRTTNPEYGDIILPWKLSKKGKLHSVDRFYHLFRSTEFTQFISPFHFLFKTVMGNRDEKTNFLFIGEIPTSEN